MNSNILAQRARIPANVLMRDIDGESVLLDLKEGRYYGLNATGTRMWQVVTSAALIADACTQLENEYDAAPDTLNADLVALVLQLSERGLLALEAG
jgi:hypothetical protein